MRKILFVLLAVICTSCRALYLSEMTPTDRYSEHLLPPLAAYLDVASFETVFAASTTYTTSSGYATDVRIGSNAYTYGNVTSTSSTFRNPLINNLNVILKNDLKNICVQYGQTKGSIVCSVVTGSHGRKIGLWPVGAAIMLGVPYLFGMPTGASKTYLKLKVDIYDSRNNLVGSYTSPLVKEKEYIALYWGYKGYNAESKTSWDAFKACMKDIKKQIANDYNRLNSMLK